MQRNPETQSVHTVNAHNAKIKHTVDLKKRIFIQGLFVGISSYISFFLAKKVLTSVNQFKIKPDKTDQYKRFSYQNITIEETARYSAIKDRNGNDLLVFEKD